MDDQGTRGELREPDATPTASRSTMPTAVPSVSDERRHRAFRRVGLGLLTVFVLLGLTGMLGVRSGTTRAADGDLTAALHHAVIARPALAVPYRLTIRRDQGFDEMIEVRISSSYLAALDENGTHPQPDGASTDADETIWEFEPPDGTVFTVWLDTRIEPGVQWRREGSTTVAHGSEIVTIDHPMWILP